MKAYFHNFWNGFQDGSDPVHVAFFLHLLTRVFGTTVSLSHDPHLADILVESCFGSHSLVHAKPWDYTFFFTGEAYYNNKVPLDEYSCVLGFHTTEDKYVALPLFIPVMYCNPYTYSPVPAVPEKMACIVRSNEGNPDAVRNKFANFVEKHIPVSYGGTFRNNIGGTISGFFNSGALGDFYKQHRFAIVFENNARDFYITEKLLNGFRAGTLPVYWGSPNIGKYFHERRVLQLKDDSETSIQACLDKMRNMADEEYLDRVRTPIFKQTLEEWIEEIVCEIRQALHI